MRKTGKKQPTKTNPKLEMPFSAVRKVFEKWLEISDPYILDVGVGALLANRFRNNPVWLFIIAPPSGMKSEFINSFSDIPFVTPLSDITPQTFISGQKGKDVSLLPKLDGQTVTFKDFTTILSKRHDALDAILSQLREIYDGKFTKPFGTGRFVEWEGHVGFVAGCTEIIDATRVLHSLLGERFILYRVKIEDRMKVATRALKNVNKVRALRKDLSNVMQSFFLQFDNVEIILPKISPKFQKTLTQLADLTAFGRVGIQRDRNTKVIEWIPTPESPARLVQIYAMLAQGIALANERSEVGGSELEILRRITLDTMIKSRRDLLGILFKEQESLSTQEISAIVGVPAATTMLHLEDLWVLKCVSRGLDKKTMVKVGERVVAFSRGGSYYWNLREDFNKKIKQAGVFD